ncbi:glycerophosphodiester phosphodiesterase family protein [Streptomyces sp. TG1A-8]|uniref:glycerophosphodiester phosphodiesterase n=1 Tax=Streptomyces sp. TG1A-8 TaxID=3051385 RepID=UPI00265B92D0|nr:glycerophosphodiester phosphodiesterase family protein [Streptomyces sp. TG1A-8]MDO0928223.1 glycerophosphodiester phosphodiesterase family protein [Streptomyces sp. TG1A-8]
MHARAGATAAAAVLGAAALLSPVPDARAGEVGAPTVIAHRGASSHAPENTLASIDKAAELGFSWVENDVQRTRDGELVVIHDDSLERTTNAEEVFPGRAPWKVKDFTAAEIARLDAGSWFSPAYAGTRVPTLTEYLRRVEHNHEKLLLEIKNPELYPGVEQQTLKLLGNEGWLDRDHLERLVVQSFSADSVRTVHELKPAVTTAYLGRPAVTELPRYAVFADLVNPSYASVSAAYVSAVHGFEGPHGKALGVFAWTVDDAASARRVAGYGVDGIITNEPEVVRAALGAD